MGPGFKYHVVTISSIFFALTIGLIVGSLFVSPRLANQSARMLVRVQKSLDQDNKKLRDRVASWEDFGKRVSPLVVKGKLSGVPVAVISTGDYPDALTAAHDALDLAGARIVSVTDIGRNLERPDEVLTPNLIQSHATEPRLPVDREGVANSIASILLHGDSLTDGMVSILEHEDLISPENDADYSQPVRMVVIVAGSRSPNSLRTTYVDQPLITALQRGGATVVMVEPSNAVVSDAETYQKMNIDAPTISDIDSDIGRTDLVLQLSSAK